MRGVRFPQSPVLIGKPLDPSSQPVAEPLVGMPSGGRNPAFDAPA